MKTQGIMRRFGQKSAVFMAAIVIMSCSAKDEISPDRFASGWVAVETEHVLVYEPPDSPRGRWQTTFAQSNEDLLLRLSNLMAVEVPEKIKIYRFITNQDCETAIGHSAGYVNGYNIYTRIGAPMGGAVALAAFTSIDPGAESFPLIREGFREAFDHPTDNLHLGAFELEAEGRRLPLAELIALPEISDREAYETQSASFVAYLIQRHGMEKFKMLWRSVLELGPSLEKIYGGTLEDIENDWMLHMEREAKKS